MDGTTGQRRTDNLPLHNLSVMGDGDAAGVRKTDPDLRDALNSAIAEMLHDGSYRRIEAKYFDFDMYGR